MPFRGLEFIAGSRFVVAGNMDTTPLSHSSDYRMLRLPAGSSRNVGEELPLARRRTSPHARGPWYPTSMTPAENVHRLAGDRKRGLKMRAEEMPLL